MRDEASGRATRIKVIAAFVAVYIVWGSTFLAIKVAVETIPPLTAAGIRFLFAGLILYSWARFRGAPKPTAAQWGNLGMLGAIMFLPVYAALFWAERTVPSGLSAVLVATQMLFGALGGAAAAALYRDASPLAIGEVMSVGALSASVLYAFWLRPGVEA